MVNDLIHAGSKLQNDLFDVLIRFRRNAVAAVCDISEMYLEINLILQISSIFMATHGSIKETKLL